MRLLILHHQVTDSSRIEAAARENACTSVTSLPTRVPDEAITLVSIGNPQVESFIGAVEHIPELGVELLPHEVITVPAGRQADADVVSAGVKSPLEIYLNALGAVGGWPSFLGYAAIAGLLAWSGLYSQTLYLLVGAMLVAPYPSPALNTAIGTARGDTSLVLRSVVRYVIALLVGVLVAFALSAAYGVESAGAMAHGIASLSTSAALLPLAAGILGGIHLSESEKSSLVSAAAGGLLITAALSPPVAVLGMAAWTGEGTLAIRASYLLLLQIVGINLTAAVTFRLRGLSTAGTWYRGGSRITVAVAASVTTLLMAGLVAWQALSPEMRRGSIAQEASWVARAQLDSVPQVRWITGETAIYGDEAEAVLLTVVRAQWLGTAGRETWRERLTEDIEAALRAQGFPEPLVELILLD